MNFKPRYLYKLGKRQIM